MDYYCYISQNKVDQLIAEFGEKNPVEWIEETSKKRDKQASGGLSKLLALFNANLSYGRSDVLQTKVNLKMSYVSKLITVLNKIADEVIEVRTISDVYNKPGKIYLYRNNFTVKEIDDKQQIACIEAVEGDEKLNLHCSLKFFSESPLIDGIIKFHSSNYAFFVMKKAVTFETLFLYISQDDSYVFGSPLYLKLCSTENLIL